MAIVQKVALSYISVSSHHPSRHLDSNYRALTSVISEPPLTAVTSYVCNSCPNNTHSTKDKLQTLTSEIMASDDICCQSDFDTLFSKNIPHILEKIFFSLDYESYKNCLEVSNEWKGVLASERYINKGKSVFKVEIVADEKKLCYEAKLGRRDTVNRLLASGMVDVN